MKTASQMTYQEFVKWAALEAHGGLLEGGGKGLESAMWRIMATFMNVTGAKWPDRKGKCS